MTNPSTEGAKTILHPVSDLEKSKPIYAALLGGPPQTDASYYVGFDVAGQHGSERVKGPVPHVF